MAKKSKTQKAKASAARKARKAERERLEESGAPEAAKQAKAAAEGSSAEEKPKKGILKRKEDKDETAKASSSDAPAKKKSDSSDSKPVKKRFQFFRDVRSEMKRVTWPTRIDVLRWSGVVVCALVFFGIFTAILDNLIVTPLLVLISGADPSTIDWFGSFSFQETSVGVDGGDASSAADVSSAADASGADAGDAAAAAGSEDAGSGE